MIDIEQDESGDIDTTSGYIDLSTSSAISYTMRPTYLWKPQADISTYELALCLPLFVSGYAPNIEELPPEAKRHFEKVETPPQ